MIGVDLGEVTIQRAELGRGNSEIPSDRLTFVRADGNGSPEGVFTAAASFAAMGEPDAEHYQLTSAPGNLSLISNGAAFNQIAPVAGFEQVALARPRADCDHQYLRGDRAVLLAR